MGKDDVGNYLRDIGRKGGAQKTAAQTEARLANIEKALSVRWGKKVKVARRNKT